MDLTQFDLKVLLVSIVALLIISVVAGGTVIGAGEVGEAPRFQTPQAPDFEVPEMPGQDVFNEGELTYVEFGEGPDHEPDDTIMFYSDGTDPTQSISVSSQLSSYNQSLEVSLFVQNPGGNDVGVFSSSVVMNESNPSASLTQNGTTVDFEYLGYNTEDNSQSVAWDLGNHVTYPGDSIGSGGPISTIADWFEYGVSIFVFAFEFVFGILGFAVLSIMDIILYVFSLISFLFSGYSGLVANSPGWAATFVAIPGIMLGLELLKIMFIIIDTLWIG